MRLRLTSWDGAQTGGSVGSDSDANAAHVGLVFFGVLQGLLGLEQLRSVVQSARIKVFQELAGGNFARDVKQLDLGTGDIDPLALKLREGLPQVARRWPVVAAASMSST